MQLDARFDLLTYLPGEDYLHKIQPYLQELLPYMTRMRELVEAGNPVASHQAFKESTNYCRWPIRQMEYSFFIRHLPKEAQGVALDAGSGVTPFPYLLINKGWETVSTDIEADQMALLTAYGKEAYGTYANHVTDDLRAMHFPDQHFSLVTCVSVLEHLKHQDVPLALAELVRVCKPGGRIIISTDVYPVDHPYIPLDYGAFTDTKIELMFSLLAKASNAQEPFLTLLNRLENLSLSDLEKFWATHWQPGFWEGNRGYGAIGMVFDLPTDEKICQQLIEDLRELIHHPLLSKNESAVNEVSAALTPHLKQKEIGIVNIKGSSQTDLFNAIKDCQAEALICDYEVRRVYATSDINHPENIIAAAKQAGFPHYLVIKRQLESETISINASIFVKKQCGEFIFLKEDLFLAAKNTLDKLVAKKDIQLFGKVMENAHLRKICEERLALIQSFDSQLKQLTLKPRLNSLNKFDKKGISGQVVRMITKKVKTLW